MIVDDVFSSLSGLTFDWNLVPDTESGTLPVVSAHNVLRSVSFCCVCCELNVFDIVYVLNINFTGHACVQTLSFEENACNLDIWHGGSP